MKKHLDDMLSGLADTEAAFVGSKFLAPVLRGCGVMVKIAGVRCNLSVEPAGFVGWGVFRATSHSQARLTRKASAIERQKYLRLLPAVGLIVCSIDRNRAHATPANSADDRFHFSGPVRIQLCNRIALFDTVVSRFDGMQFWFDEIDPRADAGAAAQLRRDLATMVEPKKLERDGLTKGHRIAYTQEYIRRATRILADRRQWANVRLTLALAHAGAELRDFAETDDAYRVSFAIDGRRHTSIVRKGDLTVQSAGICLSGQDCDFDLNSLVGVLRESAEIERY